MEEWVLPIPKESSIILDQFLRHDGDVVKFWGAICDRAEKIGNLVKRSEFLCTHVKTMYHGFKVIRREFLKTNFVFVLLNSLRCFVFRESKQRHLQKHSTELKLGF